MNYWLFVTSIVSLTFSNIVNAAFITPSYFDTGVVLSASFWTNTTTGTTPLSIIDGDINSGIVLYSERSEQYGTNHGPFGKAQFNIGDGVDSLTLNMTIGSTDTSGGSNVAFRVWNYATNEYSEFHDNNNGLDGIDSFSLTFSEAGNNGSKNLDISFSDIVSPEGEVTFLAYGPFVVSSGIGELHINEVNIVTSVVPVPAAIWLFGSGLIGLIGFSRRMQRMIIRNT